MAIAYNIRLDGLNALERLRVKVSQVPAELGMFGDEYRRRHGQEWESIKFSSGAVVFRGEEAWPAPADQYTRKTDGLNNNLISFLMKLLKAGGMKEKKFRSFFIEIKIKRRWISLLN